MVLAFFYSERLVYMHIAPKGVTIGSPGQVPETYQEEEAWYGQQEWFLHWNNAPVNIATIIKNWLAARAIRCCFTLSIRLT
jgi:hypothetical protein